MIDTVYISLDQDWVDDVAMAFVLSMLSERGCKATLFVTHSSPLTSDLANNPLIERAIHPNFNPLLSGKAQERGDTSELILDELKTIVPEAVSLRSHCLVAGTPIMRASWARGLRIDANPYLPFRQVGDIRPWRFWTGTLAVPFVWSDYIDFVMGKDPDPMDLLDMKNVTKVVAFHPIHIFLNTLDNDHYVSAKNSELEIEEKRKTLRGDGVGVEVIFERFLDTVVDRGSRTGFLRDFLSNDPSEPGNDDPEAQVN